MNPSILLCCIHPFSQIEEISNQRVFELISKYGKVIDLVMFTKGKTWKFFVEMASESDLQSVLANLNKVTIKIGKVNVYKSNKTKLKKHKHSQIQKVKNIQTNNSFILTSDSNSETNFFQIFKNNSVFQISKNHFSKDESQNENQFLNINPNFPQNLKVQKIIFLKLSQLQKITCQILLNIFGCFGNIKKLFLNVSQKFSLIEYQTQKQAEIAFKNLDGLYLFKNTLKLVLLPFPSLNSNYLQQNQIGKNINPKNFNQFPTKNMSHNNLNHFSKENSKKKINEFSNEKTNQNQFENLDQFSNEKKNQFQIEKSQKKMNYFSNEKNQKKILMQGHYKYYRYKKGLNIKINPPSKILHLTSISEKLCPIILYEIVRRINKPVRIVKLGKKGTNSNMFLVCFETVEESVEVLAVLHNKKIDRKILKVSFSHTKFD